MKYIILFIMAFGLTSSVYAAPFRCDMAGGAVFADKNVCDAACSGETGQKECEELEPASGGQPCDTGRYRGFTAVNGKTFAITSGSVTWKAENTAKIRNADDNKVVAKLLKTFGVQNAWIGAEDRKRSTAYNNIDPSRFVWRDNSTLNYSNWRRGEPNNSFDASLIGAPVYGEHWAAINIDGYWNDLGLDENGAEPSRSG